MMRITTFMFSVYPVNLIVIAFLHRNLFDPSPLPTDSSAACS